MVLFQAMTYSGLRILFVSVCSYYHAGARADILYTTLGEFLNPHPTRGRPIRKFFPGGSAPLIGLV